MKLTKNIKMILKLSIILIFVVAFGVVGGVVVGVVGGRVLGGGKEGFQVEVVQSDFAKLSNQLTRLVGGNAPDASLRFSSPCDAGKITSYGQYGDFIKGSDASPTYWVPRGETRKYPVGNCTGCGFDACKGARIVTENILNSHSTGVDFTCSQIPTYAKYGDIIGVTGQSQLYWVPKGGAIKFPINDCTMCTGFGNICTFRKDVSQTTLDEYRNGEAFYCGMLSYNAARGEFKKTKEGDTFWVFHGDTTKYPVGNCNICSEFNACNVGRLITSDMVSKFNSYTTGANSTTDLLAQHPDYNALVADYNAANALAATDPNKAVKMGNVSILMDKLVGYFRPSDQDKLNIQQYNKGYDPVRIQNTLSAVNPGKSNPSGAIPVSAAISTDTAFSIDASTNASFSTVAKGAQSNNTNNIQQNFDKYYDTIYNAMKRDLGDLMSTILATVFAGIGALLNEAFEQIVKAIANAISGALLNKTSSSIDGAYVVGSGAKVDILDLPNIENRPIFRDPPNATATEMNLMLYGGLMSSAAGTAEPSGVTYKDRRSGTLVPVPASIACKGVAIGSSTKQWLCDNKTMSDLLLKGPDNATQSYLNPQDQVCIARGAGSKTYTCIDFSGKNDYRSALGASKTETCDNLVKGVWDLSNNLGTLKDLRDNAATGKTELSAAKTNLQAVFNTMKCSTVLAQNSNTQAIAVCSEIQRSIDKIDSGAVTTGSLFNTLDGPITAAESSRTQVDKLRMEFNCKM